MEVGRKGESDEKGDDEPTVVQSNLNSLDATELELGVQDDTLQVL
jgi:hypothetical protein